MLFFPHSLFYVFKLYSDPCVENSGMRNYIKEFLTKTNKTYIYFSFWAVNFLCNKNIEGLFIFTVTTKLSGTTKLTLFNQNVGIVCTRVYDTWASEKITLYKRFCMHQCFRSEIPLYKVPVPQKYVNMWKGHHLEFHCTNIQRKCLSSNKIIHFKVNSLRGDYPNGSQIVPLLKFLPDPFIIIFYFYETCLFHYLMNVFLWTDRTLVQWTSKMSPFHISTNIFGVQIHL